MRSLVERHFEQHGDSTHLHPSCYIKRFMEACLQAGISTENSRMHFTALAI